MADQDTLRFYAANSRAYARHRGNPTGASLTAFLAPLPPSARIVELGCGNGTDAAHMLALGFDVDATDGTSELAQLASHRLGRPVRVLRFEALDAQAAYDGVWAAASLLHVPAADLADVLSRIRHALRPGGVFTASYKAGRGEGRDSLGRYYNYPDAAGLEAAYRHAGWESLALESTMGSGYDALPTEWLWMTARR